MSKTAAYQRPMLYIPGMRSQQLRELKAEFDSLMAKVKNAQDLHEKLAILDEIREIVVELYIWIKQSIEYLREMRDQLNSARL